jgi:hypothetical protein
MIRGACWGVFRERAHSPGREADDADILRLTGKNLTALGFDVTFKTPEELDGAVDEPPALVFLMCEREEHLARLEPLGRAGARMVNSPAAVLNTYRETMVERLTAADVGFVASRLVSTAGRAAWPGRPSWVKRADVHNTQDGDVVLASSAGEYRAALDGLAARDIPRAVIQPHVDGDLIKFYGIGRGIGRDGGPPWFRWFYHRDQALRHYRFDPRALAGLVRRAGGALALEIFGGDVIVTPTGELVLLDVNAWPSFALYREEAAHAIAAYLAARCDGSAA